MYGDGTEIYVPATAVDDNCKEGLHDLIRLVISGDPARTLHFLESCAILQGKVMKRGIASANPIRDIYKTQLRAAVSPGMG